MGDTGGVNTVCESEVVCVLFAIKTLGALGRLLPAARLRVTVLHRRTSQSSIVVDYIADQLTTVVSGP